MWPYFSGLQKIGNRQTDRDKEAKDTNKTWATKVGHFRQQSFLYPYVILLQKVDV